MNTKPGRSEATYWFDPTIRRLLQLIALAACVLLVALLLPVIITFASDSDPKDRIELLKLYVASMKFIGAGVLVSAVVALIPKGLSEARASFARRERSVVAFSRAKTGVDYLAIRLCALPLNEASASLQHIHVWKHRSQLYRSDVEDHLRVREEEITPEQWADLLYRRLREVRSVLERYADEWDKLTPRARLVPLKHALEKANADWKDETNCDLPD